MDKMLRIVPMVLFCSFSIKALILAPTLCDGLFLAILGLLIAFVEYKASESRLKILIVKQEALELQIKDLTTHHIELKSKVQALNMGANFSKLQSR